MAHYLALWHIISLSVNKNKQKKNSPSTYLEMVCVRLRMLLGRFQGSCLTWRRNLLPQFTLGSISCRNSVDTQTHPINAFCFLFYFGMFILLSTFLALLRVCTSSRLTPVTRCRPCPGLLLPVFLGV